jgi:hypothetical protein
MTDPFLLSANDDDDDATRVLRPAGKNEDLAFRSGLPREYLDRAPAEVVEDLENAVTLMESWAGLAADLQQVLEAAGFRLHDPYGEGGGFHIATHVREDGVLVDWNVRDRTNYEPGSFEVTVEAIVRSALEAILGACGFAAEAIPQGQDNAGLILVRGRNGTPGTVPPGRRRR